MKVLVHVTVIASAFLVLDSWFNGGVERDALARHVSAGTFTSAARLSSYHLAEAVRRGVDYGGPRQVQVGMRVRFD
ncbi:hypothetical protein ACUN0C_08530 [Faunimonas sp. B44]|uniref:hypothetical protein n=1 Tax=Faunimonas sp. B44 TaxID=3461493 RepID=UPI004044CCB7